MATATLTKTMAPRGEVNPGLVRTYGEIFSTKRDAPGFLKGYNIERDEEIELLGISLVAGIDSLFIGEAGVGKTWMIELLMRVLDGASPQDFFNTMIFKETPAQDVLGPMNLAAMKAGRIERIMDGYLPTAVVAYLDEVFKGSPTFLNALLDLMAQRKLKVGSTIHDARQLLCIYGSSNELPDREDLLPFRDRWGITKVVQAVRAPENRKIVMGIQDEYQASARSIDLSSAPRLTLEDAAKMRDEARRIEIPDTVFETMVKAQDNWGAKGFQPSQRRIGQMLMAMKARAWSRGRGQVSTDDIIVCQHMAWNHPDNADDAHNVVLEFANSFAKKAARQKEALEPILTEIQGVRDVLNSGGNPDDHFDTGFKAMRDLRRLKREAKADIETGKNQGHDVTNLEVVLSEIVRAHDWVQDTLGGGADD